jgi:hypothetical protein
VLGEKDTSVLSNLETEPRRSPRKVEIFGINGIDYFHSIQKDRRRLGPEFVNYEAQIHVTIRFGMS